MVGTSGIHMGVAVQKDISNGLEHFYALRSTMAYFIQVDLGGYPGVLASQDDERVHNCVLELGVSDASVLQVEYQDYGGATNPCQQVQAVGRAVIATLKGA